MNLNINQIQFKYDDKILYPYERQYLTRVNNSKNTWTKIWERSFEPGDIVVDIGAYLGVISIQLALLGAIVHAFEGSPRNFTRLKEIIKPLRQIIVHPVAVSNVKKICTTKFNDCIGREHPEQCIEYVIYDDYTNKHKITPRFIKIDIEGMETLALFGMKNLLVESRPIWQIEYHAGLPFHYSEYPGFIDKKNGGFDFEEFTKNHYYIMNDRFERIKIIDMENSRNYENFFFIPEEKSHQFIRTKTFI